MYYVVIWFNFAKDHRKTSWLQTIAFQIIFLSIRNGTYKPWESAVSSGGASGSRTVNREPAPSLLFTVIFPPCCSTIWRALARPMPIPLICPATFPARRNLSKMYGRSLVGIPMPLSWTVRIAQEASLLSSLANLTVIVPPSGLYLMAFERRFAITLSNRVASQYPMSSATLVLIRNLWRSEVCWYSITAC